MSIDWLEDLEREIDNGQDHYACPGLGRNQWVMGDAPEDLKTQATRTANHKKMAVNIVRLASKHEAVAGDLFLVPTKIGGQDTRGEQTIQWAVVETKEASEMMRDLRFGQAPYFCMQVIETINPAEAE